MICDLEPSTHVAQVWRHGFMEGEENFIVQPGRTVVVGPLGRPTCLVGDRERSPEPTTGAVDSGGLAAAGLRPTVATAVTH